MTYFRSGIVATEDDNVVGRHLVLYWRVRMSNDDGTLSSFSSRDSREWRWHGVQEVGESGNIDPMSDLAALSPKNGGRLDA